MFFLPGQKCLGKVQEYLDPLLSPGTFVGFLSVVFNFKKRKTKTGGYKLIQCYQYFMEDQFVLKGYHN